MAFGKCLDFNSPIIEIRVLIVIPNKDEIIKPSLFKRNKRLKILETMKILGFVLKIKEKELSPKIPNFSFTLSSLEKKGYPIYSDILLVYVFLVPKKIFLKCLVQNSKSNKLKEVPILLSRKYFGYVLNPLVLDCIK